jgi:hypothetical protein
MKKIALATVLALVVMAPAIAQPPLTDEVTSSYFELRDLVKGNTEKCIKLIQISKDVNRIRCIDVVNKLVMNFNRISENMCGSEGLWTGTTFCVRSKTRMPYLDLEVKLLGP